MMMLRLIQKGSPRPVTITFNGPDDELPGSLLAEVAIEGRAADAY